MEEVTLEDLIRRLETLKPGDEFKVVGNFCRHCGSTDLVVKVGLEALESSLAGMQAKVSAKVAAVLVCNGCGHNSGS